LKHQPRIFAPLRKTLHASSLPYETALYFWSPPVLCLLLARTCLFLYNSSDCTSSQTLDEFLEDAFEDDTMEDEADEIVQQTLLGIGVDLSASMQDAPMGAPAVAKPQGAAAVGSEGEAATPNAAAGEEDARLVAELEARFGALAS